MDGISGAASLITVFGLALSSTQAIYNVVSSIKKGPNTIKLMISNLQDLLKLLQQLTRCTDQSYRTADLEVSVSKCAQDLRAFEDQLTKLFPKADNRAVRVWKHVKATLQEKDLERMSAAVQRHVAAISLQLQIIEGGRGSSHSMSLERVEALSNTQLVLSTKNASTLETTGAVVNQVCDSIQALGTIANASHQSTSVSMEQLSNKVEHLAGLSIGQSETLNATCNAILELLKQQLPSNPQHSATKAFQHEAISPGVMYISEEAETAEKTHINSGENHGLQYALDRLCHFANHKEKTAFSEEAETIIRNLQHIFKLLLKAEEEDCAEERKGKRYRESYERDSTDDSRLYQSEVKRIKRLLGASHCVSINETASRSSAPTAARYKKRNTHYQRHLQNGTITIQGRYMYGRFDNASRNDAQDKPTDVPELLEMSFAFLPKNSQNPWIAVKMQQRMSYEGSFLKKPALSISALLHPGAEVFRLIEKGDLNGLIQLLSLREASLTDRDLEGRSLLSYANYFAQPDICKFLIDKGADVEFLEPSIVMSELYVSSLDQSSANDVEVDPEELPALHRCIFLLLEAGADPTLFEDQSSSAYSYIGRMLYTGTTETIRMVLDHGFHFVELDGGLTPDIWLHHHLCLSTWALESIVLLLHRQGKGGLPIQQLHGCLHLAILGSHHAEIDELTDALILLIREGADIYARDRSGYSVSDIACCKKTRWRYGANYGPDHFFESPYNLDLRLRSIWMEALTACGYDAEEVISSSTRIEELSDNDDESQSAQYEDWDSAESDDSEGYTDSPSCRMSDDCEAEFSLEGDDVSDSADPPYPNNQYEQSLLEGDAEVWGS